MATMPPWYASLDPLLVWGLYTRGLGVVLLISFASLATQIIRGAGTGDLIAPL